MIGSSLLALEQGVTPAYIALGAAAAVRRYIAESDSPEQSEAAAQKVLADVSGLAADAPLAQLILGYYRRILAGADMQALLAAADDVKAASLRDVV